MPQPPSDTSPLPSDAALPSDDASAFDDATEDALLSGMITKAFSLTREDVRLIQTVKKEEFLLSDSAALRRLIRDGLKYRALSEPTRTNNMH